MQQRMNSREPKRVTKTLAIFGASGHGKVVAELAERNGYQVVFYDDKYPKIQKLEHWDVVGNFDTLNHADPKLVLVAVAIGDNVVRKTKTELLLGLGFEFPTLIHPTAIVSKYAEIGAACVILPGSNISAFARIGMGTILNSMSCVEHDCFIGEFVHISPNAAIAGNVNIGSTTWLGIGCSVIQSISIGSGCIVGAGSVVIRDLADNSLVCGVPASPIDPHK